MSIVYPGAIDSFPVPSLPEDTSLSEAGTGTRNHTEHHADLGAAVVALESNTALRTHTHGGGTGIGSSPKLIQANTHESADTDVAASSIHHTIGTGPFQSAAGNHVHGYNTLLDRPLVVCTSNSRPASPFYGMQIWETDTGRSRVWSAFSSNTSQVGLYGHDSFLRTSSSDLGPTLWSQTYSHGAGNGIMATPDGNSASWIDQGNNTVRCMARRIQAMDRYTETDDQVITIKTGSTVLETKLLFSDAGSNDAIFRYSDDGSKYIRVWISQDWIGVSYTLNGMAEEISLGGLAVETQIPNCEWRILLVNRTIQIYRNGTFVGSVVDANSLSAKGPNNRGWGMGMQAGTRVGGFGGQCTPANVADIFIQDVTFYSATNKWTLQPGGQIPILRLLQGSAQPISPGAGSIMEWRNETEDTFGMFNPSTSMTDINIKESGVYNITAAVAWNAGAFGDEATLGLEINGLDTPYKSWKFVRGNGFTAGFSQTVSLSVPAMRFAEGDVLRIRASHNYTFDWFTRTITSGKRVDSRLEVVYVSP